MIIAGSSLNTDVYLRIGQPNIKAGFDECMRVLKPTGTLLFKWSNNQIPFNKVFNVIDQKPILGDRRGTTRWSVFIKGAENGQSNDKKQN